MKLLLVAEESAGMRLLKELARLPHEIVAVMAQEPADEKSTASCAWNTAKQLGFETWPASLVRNPDTAERIRSAGVQMILNVHSLFIIHEALLASATIGAFNLHPGPLPACAGLNAPSWSIYNGERRHAVTLHKMAPGIDSGDIVFEHAFDITDKDTGLSVTQRCVQFGIPLVLRLVELASCDAAAIPYRAQDSAQRKYYGKAPPQEGRIRWDVPARRVYDFVRASDYAPFHSPWGWPRTSCNGRELAVTKVALTGRPSLESPGTIQSDSDGRSFVSCSDEWLELKRISDLEGSGNSRDLLDHGSRFESA